ncbi:MAG: septum site-determining protein MinC [Thiovulaceae bacterium]|nr:septum site-determining protein MinC [Sulfurimonadaceae bacterium]
MRNKQYSVKVFETTLTDEDQFISFFDTNYNLFKDYLIVIHGDISQKIEEYLQGKELRFVNNIILPKSQGRKAVEEEIAVQKEQQQQVENELIKLSDRLHNNLKVQDTLVRSGQELNIDGDLLLLNRVNSGATIIANGNLIVTQLVEGAIRCFGNFMMLKASPKANIVFHDVVVDNSLLKERLNRVELKDNEIRITPVLKETTWVM